LKERLAIKNLFVPGGMSDNFRVLVQKRIQESGAVDATILGLLNPES
jgi:hypothetical protein